MHEHSFHLASSQPKLGDVLAARVLLGSCFF